MGTKVNSNYEDLITFTRASKGHALRPVSYGDELVTNGDFSSTDLSDWIELGNPTATVSGGELTLAGDGGYDDYIQQEVGLTAGKIYTVQCTARRIVGSVRILVRYASSPYSTIEAKTFSSSSNETFTVAFVAPTNAINIQLVQWSGSTGSGVFDNISVKEVLFDQTDGTLTLFEHPDNVPRVEWDADRNRLGLLVEEARTNLVTRSEDFGNSYWNKNLPTISTDVTTAPDGTTTADKLVVNNATADTEKFVNRNIYAYVNQTVTGSVFLKKAEYTWVQVNLYNLSSNVNRVWVNLDTGAVGTNLSSIPVTVTDVGNGWYRVALTATIQQVGNAFMTIAVADADGDLYTNIGDEESGTFLWGAQLEAGSFPTSYIKTTGSTATRSADVASIPVADFGYNHDASTFIAEASELGGLNSNLQRHTLFSTETASALRLYVGKSGGGGGSGDEIYVGEGASNTYFELGDITQNTFYKVGVVVKTNDISASLNGGAIVSDSSVALAKDETTIGIGSRTYSGTNIFNGHIKKLMYIPRRVTNAQLISLTE